MADKVAYKVWQESAEEVERLARDRSLPLWQKARLVGQPYMNIPLEGLQSKHRHKILNRIGKVNAILRRYTLNSFDDYQNIAEVDLCEIVDLFRSMKPGP